MSLQVPKHPPSKEGTDPAMDWVANLRFKHLLSMNRSIIPDTPMMLYKHVLWDTSAAAA